MAKLKPVIAMGLALNESQARKNRYSRAWVSESAVSDSNQARVPGAGRSGLSMLNGYLRPSPGIDQLVKHVRQHVDAYKAHPNDNGAA